MILLAACCEPSDEQLTVSAASITNGAADDADPAVVAIMADDSLDCTGTLIASTLVLTAAHCLGTGGDLSVHFGVDAWAPDAVIPVIERAAHPAFDPETLDNDIAVLRLAFAADGVTPRQVATASDDLRIGQPLRIAGYGRTGPIGAGPTAGTRRTGTAVLARVDANRTMVMASPSQPCSGDSGGPAFASDDDDGGERVVAVTSGGDTACMAGAAMTRVSAYAAFLAPWLARPAGGCSATPGGGSALAVAVAVALQRRRRKRHVGVTSRHIEEQR